MLRAGDELSAAGGLPFHDYDRVISHFRKELGDRSPKGGKLIYYAVRMSTAPSAELSSLILGLAACSQNTAFSSVTEPTVGKDADANTSIISCTEGAWPPDGLCPAYWPHVPRALTHISLDNYQGDCFWNALGTRGIYESYLYPKMSAEQKLFVVPATAFNMNPRNASSGLPCTGFYHRSGGSFAQVDDYTVVSHCRHRFFGCGLCLRLLRRRRC